MPAPAAPGRCCPDRALVARSGAGQPLLWRPHIAQPCAIRDRAVVCEAAGMSDRAMISGSGPFWEFLAGRQPVPPAAATLGWELSWVAPERGEIEVFFDARAGSANPMRHAQPWFLASILPDPPPPALAAT